MNSPARLPRVDLDWWPDWRGSACAIIAPGPSAKQANVLALRRHVPVIAIKECAIDLVPWADVVYGCDAAWWRHRRGLPAFKGLKITWASDTVTLQADIKTIAIRENPKPAAPENKYVNIIITDEIGVIGSGHNSGFQALNLAVQFGADRVLLVGFDMRGDHYYGRNNWIGAGNPDQFQFDRCIRSFTANAPLLRELRVDVVNASPTSALTCFRRSTIEMALNGWGL